MLSSRSTFRFQGSIWPASLKIDVYVKSPADDADVGACADQNAWLGGIRCQTYR